MENVGWEFDIMGVLAAWVLHLEVKLINFIKLNLNLLNNSIKYLSVLYERAYYKCME